LDSVVQYLSCLFDLSSFCQTGIGESMHFLSGSAHMMESHFLMIKKQW